MKIKTLIVCGVFSIAVLLTSKQVHVSATEGSFFDHAGQSTPDPRRWSGLAENGSAAFASKRYDLAIKFYSAALDVASEAWPRAYIHQLRGRAYLAKSDQKSARAEYERALNFLPKTSADYQTRAWTFRQLERYQAAAADYAKAIALAPDDSEALNELAWMKATCPDGAFRSGTEAVRLSTKVCEMTGWKNANMIDTLAAAHAEAGDFARAIQYQEQAMKMRSITAEDRAEMQPRLASYRQHKPYREKRPLTAL